MNPGISIEKGVSFVHSRVRAPLTEELLSELMSRIADKAEEWGFSRHLVDLREGEKQLAVIDDYDLAYRKAREYGLKPGSIHAIIVRHEDIDEFRFVETVFLNAGYTLKIFTEEDTALDWIRE